MIESGGRHALGQSRHPAEVIAVIVRRDQVVDLLQTRVADGRCNPIRVANGDGSAVPGVHQERLPRRRHEQRRVAPFHVDQVDVEPARGRPLRRQNPGKTREKGQ